MDSPHFQSSQPQRVRTNSNLSVHSPDHRGAIHKRNASRSRSISVSHADRLHDIALQQASTADFASGLPVSAGLQWLTPQHSPQPPLYSQPEIEPFPQWTVPTPPRSDSGLPTLSVDSGDESVANCTTSAQGFHFDQPTTSAEMSSLGFLLPSQYGSNIYESEPGSYAMEQNFPPMRMSAQQPPVTDATAYGQTLSSSPALYQSRTVPTSTGRRHSELPHPNSSDPSYGQNYRRISNPYDSMPSSGYSMPQSQSIPSISGLRQSPMPSPSLNSSSGSMMSSQYGSMSRSPSMYETNGMYGQQSTTAPSATQLYASTQGMSFPPPFVGSSVNEVLAKPLGSDASIRVLNQRPKPQCWEHGCNGRQFSTFSNLLRHQREKSGTATKSYCPKCGAEFTRTTARNGHLAHDKCSKQQSQGRRPSEER